MCAPVCAHVFVCVCAYMYACVCVHTCHVLASRAQAASPGGTEEMEVEQTAAADVAGSSSSWLSAAHPSAGQACNERINFRSPQPQPRYGWLMLVQPVAFPLANPLPTLETGLAYTHRPRTGSAWHRSPGPRSWSDRTAWYRRSNSCPIADRLAWKEDWAGPCAHPGFAMC